MFKLLLSLTISFLLGSFALASANQPEAKMCRPKPCCGCDTSRAKAQVKALWKLWASYFTFPTFNTEAAIFLGTPKTGAYIWDSVCSGECCFLAMPYCEAVAMFQTNYNATMFDLEVVQLHNGTIVTENIAIASITNVTSHVYDVRLNWDLTPECNWKISNMWAKNVNCGIPL